MSASERENIRKLLWCGRFLAWKHPEAAVEAVNRLSRKGYALELDFIGIGPMENTMRTLIARYGLENCVHLLGSVSPEQIRLHMEQAGSISSPATGRMGTDRSRTIATAVRADAAW